MDAGDLRQLDLLDRIRPAEVQAGRELAHILPKSEHDADLLGVHAHGEAEETDQRDRAHGNQCTQGSAHAAARHGLTDAVLAAPQDLLKIRLLAGSCGTRAPGTAATALPTAPALIAPRHDESSS